MRKKICVIDDDPLALQMIMAVLEPEGYEVQAFSEFESLLASLQKSLPDLVMTDVVMPKTSGFDVCRIIKETFQPKPPPVIVMTGKLDAVDPVLARRMGADDFVVKTSNMAVLLQAVRNVFSKKGAV